MLLAGTNWPALFEPRSPLAAIAKQMVLRAVISRCRLAARLPSPLGHLKSRLGCPLGWQARSTGGRGETVAAAWVSCGPLGYHHAIGESLGATVGWLVGLRAFASFQLHTGNLAASETFFEEPERKTGSLSLSLSLSLADSAWKPGSRKTTPTNQPDWLTHFHCRLACRK